MKVSYNNDIITLSPNLKVKNNQPHNNENVKVVFTIPSGLVFVSNNPTKGSYSNSTKTWTIGTLAGNEEVFLKDFKLKVTNINNAPFTVTATVSGDSTDNDSGNNTYSWLIESDTCAPAAGANSDISSCLCGSVATNDTPCTKGVTEWRLNPLSVVNGQMMSWDELTGEYNFKYIDNSKDITFTYNLYCVQGVNEYLIAQNVPVVIRASVVDKRPYDHTFVYKECADLTVNELNFIQEKYPTLTPCDFCWKLLLNGDEQVTYAEATNCDPEESTKVTHQHIAVNYNNLTPGVGVELPNEHQVGDIHIVTYPNATVYFKSNGLTYTPTVHYQNSISTIVVEDVVGQPVGTKRIVITMTSGQVTTSNNFTIN